MAGAWFGGCVDSTGPVIATASLFEAMTPGDASRAHECLNTAAVVKMMQNCLIGPLSIIAGMFYVYYEKKYLSSKSDDKQFDDAQKKG